MYTRETAEQMHTPPKPTETWVHEVLERRRMLRRRTLIVLWGLRIYVLLMLL